MVNHRAAAEPMLVASGTRAAWQSATHLIARALPEDSGDTSGRVLRARLLAMLSLGLLGSCVVGAVEIVVVGPGNSVGSMLSVVTFAGLAFLIAYAAARARRVELSALVTVTTQIFATLAAYVLAGSDRLPGQTAAPWLALALLTCNAVMGARAVLGVGGLAIAALVAVESTSGAPVRVVSEGALVLGAITMALYVYSRNRDQVERARQSILRRRNDELEQLRATLEERVEQRTADLETKASELRASCASLATNQALLVRTEKMAAVGRLTAGFAHELASPLGAVVASLDNSTALCAEYARSIGDREVTDEDHREIARELDSTTRLARMAAERAVTFVRGIRAHTRDPGVMATERFDVCGVASQVTTLLAYAAREAKVALDLRCDEAAVFAHGVPSRVNQAITNLVQNAIDATAETGRGGRVVVRVSSEHGDAIVRVEDDGPGIPDAILPRVMEPLFTTKAYGKGTGLGLAIVNEIVRDEMRGRISIETNVGKGTAFVVSFPQSGEQHGA